MELKWVFRFVLRRWWLMLIPVAVVAVVAVPELLRNEQTGAGGYQTSFQYSAAQETSNFPEREGDYQDVWLASEFVVNAFTDWVRSSSFRDELGRALDDPSLDLSRLAIAADNNRSIGVVYMSHPDAAALERIAAAAIDVLQTRNQDYFPHLGNEPALVTLLDAPVVTPAPPPLTNRFAPILQLGVALLFGIALALLVEYFDPALRTRDELEAQGIPVLATIPKR